MMKYQRENIVPYLFVLPAVVLFSMLIVLPIGKTIYYSFFEWSGGAAAPMKFIGLKNYVRAFFYDDVFLGSFKNNLIYMLLTLILEVGTGLFLAVLLNGKGRFFGLFRAMFFAPMMLSMVVVGLLWSFVYDPDYGLLNAVLKMLGLGSVTHAWLGDPTTALYSICVVSGWVYAGFYMTLFYAGLQRIPQHIIEAARIDGASEFQTFRHITLPMLREVIIIAVLICITGAFKAFDLFYVMTNGGPYHSTEVVSTWLVAQAFSRMNIGYGSSIAVIMSFVVLGVAVVYLSYTKRKSKLEY